MHLLFVKEQVEYLKHKAGPTLRLSQGALRLGGARHRGVMCPVAVLSD